jgi:2-dehydro-3-deoxyphosphogluconate aldolase / (4S)-4-hydroxy-2-oxoglutarate aldolase
MSEAMRKQQEVQEVQEVQVIAENDQQETLRSILEQTGLLAVLEVEDADTAVPVAKALVRGGITGIELALRTDAAGLAIKRIAEAVPEMKIGVGTIIWSGQSKLVKQLGAHFGLSPGLNSNIVREALALDFPFAPGIATPSELETALNLGCRILKFFPAEGMGGLAYLQSINAPYRYLGLSFIPLGGVTESSLPVYLENPHIAAVGGTWIAKREAIRSHDWDGITRRAEKAMNIWHRLRG